MLSSALLKVAMAVRQVKIDDGEAQNHHDKVKNAKPGSAWASPRGAARESQIGDVQQQDEQSDHIFRIVVPILASETVDPDESENCADADGDEAD